jgi:hypothetical protein
MNSENSAYSVSQSCGTSFCIEALKSPLHSNLCLNGIPWREIDSAALSDVEFEDILDSDVPVLSTESLFYLPILIDSFIPLIHVDILSIYLNLLRNSIRIGNSNSHSSSFLVMDEFK